jgi:hypothetical protein
VSPAVDHRLRVSGFTRTILKPIDPWELCKHIVEVLGR